ncbi:MAG: cation transporter, partial [Paenibacillus sp. RIFOXYA1_FULL_44_5]
MRWDIQTVLSGSMTEHFKKARFAAWLGVVGHILLALLKGMIAWLASSKALLADAIHSVSDAAGQAAFLIGIKAAWPANGNQANGQDKAESIASIVIASVFVLAGFELGKNAIVSMVQGVHAIPHWYALAAVVIVIFLKEAMYRYKYRLGKKMSSQSLIASALEHRSDVYSSIAALTGIAGALLGQYFQLHALYNMDSLAGLFIAFLIVRRGYILALKAVHIRLDHGLTEEDSAELMQTVQKVRGVIEVDELRAREQGHYVIVDLKISVNPHITVMEGHDIAKAVKYQL